MFLDKLTEASLYQLLTWKPRVELVVEILPLALVLERFLQFLTTNDHFQLSLFAILAFDRDFHLPLFLFCQDSRLR